MNVDAFTSLLQDPGKLASEADTRQLEEVLQAYPWFQPARALYLKGLHQMNSYKYNQALKVTAACTADREVLFDYITSDTFLQNSIARNLSGDTPLAETEIVSEPVDPSPESDTGMVEQEQDSPLPRSAAEADQILDPRLFRSVDPQIDEKLEAARKQARETLQMGRPLEFTRKERHSFSEWLQITSFKRKEDRPIPGQEGSLATGAEAAAGTAAGQTAETPAGTREDASAGARADDPASAGTPQPARAREEQRRQKFERISRFIEKNPKIVPDKEAPGAEVDIKSSVKLDKEELMTETLARVYLEQGKHKKAIQAYRILSLKYPEKSGFFADRIKAVEQLRRDKSK